MLTIKKRQEYLRTLGFYTGDIDGIEGKLTKKAYADLQEKYFTREDDKDGIYGNNTEMLLINAYYTKLYCKNFKLEEFKCQCGGKYCTGYPAILDADLLKNLQKLRDKYGAITITSGMRCTKHNANVGGVSNSKHKSGQAVDFRAKDSSTLAGRKKIMSYFRTLPNQRYTYCNENGNYPNMGNSIHIDVY